MSDRPFETKTLARYPFPGSPRFLEIAARKIGKPEAARPSLKNPALSALANLCAQAADTDDDHVVDIIQKASESRDELQVALIAADLMIADVLSKRGFPVKKTSISITLRKRHDRDQAKKVKREREPREGEVVP